MNYNVQEVWANLRSHRVQVVQELRVDRTLLFDYLRSKEVFDSEDCELVNAEKTNERKASRLLDILQTKATESLVYFVDVLQLLNPSLYEKLTGYKATARENPILNEVGDKPLIDLDPQRDLDILSSHLKRAVADLQEMTLRYDQLLKENQRLSKSLSEVTRDRDLKFKHLQTAEDQVVRADERAREAWHNAGIMEKTANVQKTGYEKAISDKYACLLAMMSSVEETKQLRKKVEEERQRNEELLCKLQGLSQNFDHERNHSQKLSERLVRQRSSVKSAEDLKDQYRELQFISQKLQMEKDQAISELNELKNWAEALKAHYDIVEKNKQQCQESYDNAVVDCSQFKRKIQDLQFQLALLKRQGSNHKAENDELTRLVKKYQEQRDFYDEERVKAISERDEARRERDEMYQQFSDIQKEKDEAMRKFLLETRNFERRHEIDTAEIRALRERLVQTEKELKTLKIEWERFLNIKASISVSANVECSDVHMKKKSTEGNNDYDNDDVHDEVFGRGKEADQDWKSRPSKELVNSIKNRFYNPSESLSLSDIPREDPALFCAQWMSRLPCQALIPLLCPTSVKSPSGEIFSAANAFNFDFLPLFSSKDSDSGVYSKSPNSPITNGLSDLENLQEIPMKLHCSGERKREIAHRPCVIDDNAPEPRSRANALDRTSLPWKKIDFLEHVSGIRKQVC